MEQVAENLYLLRGKPKYAINVYLMGDVLLDAGSRMAERRILAQLEGRDVTAHAITHAHPDHQGSSHAVCEKLGIPLLCGHGDAEAMESGDWNKVIPNNWSTKPQHRFWTGPAHPVSKRLQEGDQVAGFTVLEVPGHAPGHLAFWRESDRMLILGDVLNGMNLLTTMPGLHQPPNLWTPDPDENRRSIRKVASLKPDVVCFGHGPPMRDAADKLNRFADALPK
jgi:glyoxylase-like metal-dependent hydrolase (beta-lactamase superfamily II)